MNTPRSTPAKVGDLVRVKDYAKVRVPPKCAPSGQVVGVEAGGLRLVVVKHSALAGMRPSKRLARYAAQELERTAPPPVKLTDAQRRMLVNVAKGRQPSDGFVGGGSYNTLMNLLRRGLLDDAKQITLAGKSALDG